MLGARKDCSGLALASNKTPCSPSIALPPQWDGDQNQKKKGKLIGWNKDSLIG